MRRNASVDAVSPCRSVEELIYVLGHTLTVEILLLLAGRGETTVSELTEMLDLGMSAVSRILRLLHSRGILAMRRQKTQHLYSIAEQVSTDLKGGTLELAFTATDESIIAIKFSPGAHAFQPQ